MTNVDQFESVFRSADKAVFADDPVTIESVLIVTDRTGSDAYEFGEDVKSFLSILNEATPTWDVVTGDEFTTSQELLTLVEARQPGLICTYRHLHATDGGSAFTLGDSVETLTQACAAPVMVVPHPDARRTATRAMKDTNIVMAMTDHLTGDDRLVNMALRFVEPAGTLFLTHVEDRATFDRYIDTIARIQHLNTDVAREEIGQQLLKEPHDFITSCREAIAQRVPRLHVEEIVTMGTHLALYKELVEQHEVDLLVFNTRDNDQLAMHGLAYPLAVELRETALLML